MGSKKRKESTGSTDQPLKKNKKSKTAEVKDVAQPETQKPVAIAAKSEPAPLPSDDAPVVKSKKSRKRAADFMNDEEEAPATESKKDKTAPSVDTAVEPTKQKKSKKSKKTKEDALLSADGVNGVIEHAEDANLDTATSHNPVSTSMQAEAERTVDQELEDGFGGFASEDDYPDEVEADDNAAALLAGFDSDAEDNQQDEGFDLTNAPSVAASKKVQKKLNKAKAQGNDQGPGTVYVGRIPHGFYEKQMREYFSQFGEISRLRLSRNKRTGASKHFAFIEFSSKDVAKIVAETMDTYLLFGHILRCKFAEQDSLHPDLWKGADKKFRKIPHEKLERESLAAPKSEDKWQKKVDKEQRKRDKKAEKMKSIGLDMPKSTLTKPSVALERALADQAIQDQIEAQITESAGLIEPPKDDGATKETNKPKKEKKDKKSKKDRDSGVTTLEPAVADSVDEAPAEAIEESQPTPEAEAEPTDEADVDTPASKKSKAQKKAEKKTAKASKKLAKVDDRSEAQAPSSDPVSEPETEGELSADFISLGKFDEEPSKGKEPIPKNVLKPWKVQKPKKDRKNLVKARGPESALVATKPNVETSNTNSKIPGLPLMGKGKYDKATRQAHKEMKANIMAKRGARGRGGA